MRLFASPRPLARQAVAGSPMSCAGGNLPAFSPGAAAETIEFLAISFPVRDLPLWIPLPQRLPQGGRDMENSELVAKVERWLNDVSDALHRLSRERDVLRETRTQILMGVLSTAQAEANLSRLIQWRDGESSGLPADIVARLR